MGKHCVASVTIRALLGLIGPYCALLGLIGPYWALLGLVGSASLGSNGLYDYIWSARKLGFP